MGMPAARLSDTVAGGKIVKGSSKVLIGDADAYACSTCPKSHCTGNPVNPVLGAKVLSGPSELDFALPGPLPFVAQRQYSSYVNAEHGGRSGFLGYGWTLPLNMYIRTTDAACMFFDASGRVITFKHLAPGHTLHSRSEQLHLMRGLTNADIPTFVDPLSDSDHKAHRPTGSEGVKPWFHQRKWQHLPHQWRANSNCIFASAEDRTTLVFAKPLNGNGADGDEYLLAHVVDSFGRMQSYEYDKEMRLTAVIDGIGRKFTFLYQQILLATPTVAVNSASNAVAISAGTDASPRWLPDNGLRLIGIELTQDPSSMSNQKVSLVRYSYDSHGDLIEVTDRYGVKVRQFVYQNHLMVEHRVCDGPWHRYVYEHTPPQAGDRVVAQNNESGLSYRFEYFEETQKGALAQTHVRTISRSRTVVTDSLRRVETYHCDGDGGRKRVVTRTWADGSQERYQYDAAGHLTQEIDPLGRKTQYFRDQDGKVQTICYADGSRSSNEWDRETGLLLSSTGLDGRITRYAHDVHGRLLRISQANGIQTSYRYADVPQIPSPLDSASLHGTTRLSVDKPIQVVDAKGGVSHLEWDGCGNLVRRIDCSGQQTQYRYDEQGRLTQAVNALGQRSQTEYDRFGRVSASIGPDGSQTQYRYDNRGQLLAIVLTRGKEVILQRDAVGRIVARQFGDTSRSFVYDAADRLTCITNENGAQTLFSYDAMDRVSQEVGFDGRTQLYSFNRAGELISVSDGTAHEGSQLVTSYRYDKFSRLIEKKIPQTSSSPAVLHRFEYNKVHLQRIEVLSEEAMGMGTNAYTALEKDAKRRKFSQVEWTRDVFGRVNGEIQTLFDERNQVEFTHRIQHRLSVLGVREQTKLVDLGAVGYLTYGSGHLHGITLDDVDVLSIERDTLHREVERHIPALTMKREYDVMGRLSRQVLAGFGLGSAANADNRAAFLIHQLDRHYQYDVVGQLIGIKDPKNPLQVFREYAYDHDGHLVASRSAGASISNTYRFDPAGNRLPMPLPEGVPARDWATYVHQNIHNKDFNLLEADPSILTPSEVKKWPTNRVGHNAGTHYEYDIWGNRLLAMALDGSKQTYGYDALQQLTTIECFDQNGNTTSKTRYQYDAAGRRLAKRVSSTGQEAHITYYGWDGDQLVRTETQNQIFATVFEPGSFVPMLSLTRAKSGFKPPQAFETLGAHGHDFEGVGHLDMLDPPSHIDKVQLMSELAVIQQNYQNDQESRPLSIHFYQCDHLGTPRALMDTQGHAVWLAEYDDWGRLTQVFNPLQLEQPIRFQGQFEDGESGLFYNRFRYYDPDLGQYLNQDPIGFEGGLNAYSYVGGQPQGFTDPLGLYPALCIKNADGTTTVPMTQVKNAAQAKSYGDALGSGQPLQLNTPVAIAVPPGVDPQAQVDDWGTRTLNGPVPFAYYWRPKGPNDYKYIDAKYDAYGNFAYGATGRAAGYSCKFLQYVANDVLKGGKNNSINTADIAAGCQAISNGGKLCVQDYTIPSP